MKYGDFILYGELECYGLNRNEEVNYEDMEKENLHYEAAIYMFLELGKEDIARELVHMKCILKGTRLIEWVESRIGREIRRKERA
jgi:hypothetical protein